MPGQIIEINLLPSNLRKQKAYLKFDLNRLPVTRIIALSISVLVGVWFFLIISTQLIKFNIVQLNNKWQSMSTEKKELDIIKKEIASLKKDANIISRLTLQPSVWSKRLNAISDSVAAGIWLRELSMQEISISEAAKAKSTAEYKAKKPQKKITQKFLSISGSALMVSGVDGTANVGKFMSNLKSNKDFSDSFQDIRLGSIQRRFIKNVEVMDFTISCFFKEK